MFYCKTCLYTLSVMHYAIIDPIFRFMFPRFIRFCSMFPFNIIYSYLFDYLTLTNLLLFYDCIICYCIPFVTITFSLTYNYHYNYYLLVYMIWWLLNKKACWVLSMLITRVNGRISSSKMLKSLYTLSVLLIWKDMRFRTIIVSIERQTGFNTQ